MEFDAAPASLAYTNRPAPRAGGVVREGRVAHVRSRAPGRAMDRMLVALRGYEQRAQRRASFAAWLLARRAAADASRA